MIFLFDQYQRYKNTQLIIETMRAKKEKFTILEVGANEHKNLEQFLPNDEIKYIDINLSEKMRNDSSYILGDATDMDFKDDAFDIIVALDVFEHISNEGKHAFLKEVARVSKRGFVICAPFNEDGVHEAERRVNANYECMYGRPHPWLAEHLENGLPELEETLSILNELKTNVSVFSHGDLDMWERMTNIEMAADCNPALSRVGLLLHDYYNQYIFELDYKKSAYRYFLVSARQEYVPIQRKVSDLSAVMKKFDMLEKNFWTMYNSLKEKDLGANSPNKLQIYFDLGDGVTEDTQKTIILDGHSVTLRQNFQDKQGRVIKGLRIDPTTHGGLIKMNRLAIFDKDNHVIWEGVPNVSQCRNVIYQKGEYFLFFDDPQIIISQVHHSQIIIELDYKFVECRMEDEMFWHMFADKLILEDRNFEQKRKELEQQNKELEQENKELAQESKELAQESKALGQEKKELERHKAALEQEKNQMSLQLLAVYQSTSWKVTKPYRFLARGIKKLAKCFIPAKVRQGMWVILHEGFSVFFRRTESFIRRNIENKKYVSELIAPNPHILNEERKHVFERKVLFSIIVPLFNTPSNYLVEMIESCQKQTYGMWELCLADGSDMEHSYVGKIVCKMAEKDSRIKYKKLERNDGISENTNAGLKMAKGDYIALLDHDDLLHPSVLYKYMEVICEQNADYIYCDEMTFEGKLKNVITMHFKPDFAIDNLRANNYICHFSVFAKNLLEQAGMFRKEYDGSQDHDMVLRLTEKAKKIVHLPQILYFWRSHPASVASDINSKIYAIDAGKNAVLSHIKRCGLEGRVESSKAFPTIYNVRYKIKGNPMISILIPNKDNVEMLSCCVKSILQKSTYDNYEVLIIENNSTKSSTFHYYDKIQENSKIRVVYFEEEGFNYSAINNFGVKHAKGEYILFLNNDIEIISSSWMEEMLMFAQRKDVGAVGAKLYYPDNTIQHAGIIIGLGADRCAGHHHYKVPLDNVGYMGRLYYAQNYSAVTAACMMLKKDIFEEIGGFNEDFAVAYNDVDLCLSIRKAGYLNVWTPLAEAYHYESVSRGYDTTLERREQFQKEVNLFKEKWKSEIEKGDPYYNVNLTLDSSDFSLRV